MKKIISYNLFVIALIIIFSGTCFIKDSYALKNVKIQSIPVYKAKVKIKTGTTLAIKAPVLIKSIPSNGENITKWTGKVELYFDKPVLQVGYYEVKSELQGDLMKKITQQISDDKKEVDLVFKEEFQPKSGDVFTLRLSVYDKNIMNLEGNIPTIIFYYNKSK